MGYTGLSGEKWTFRPVIKAGLVGKIKIQSRSPVTTTHHHVSGHCHVVDCLILCFSPLLLPLLVLPLLFSPTPRFFLPYMGISYAKVKSDGK